MVLFSITKLFWAEDEEINYMLVREIFKRTNNKLIRVLNGKEAIEYFNNNKVDLILMDLKMPVMNGYEAIIEIRNKNKEVPIIALTAYALSGDRKKAMKLGCNGYITKPVNKAKLMKSIQIVIEQLEK